MGVYRPVVERFQRGGGVHSRPTSEKKVTLANAMSVARPVLGAVAAYKLIRDKDGALTYAATGAATDMEGIGARLWDKMVEKLGKVATVPEVLKNRGTTIHGEKLDPAADFAYAAEMAIGIAAGKKTSRLAKAAAAVSVYKGQSKARWYAQTNTHYENARSAQGLEAEKLVVPVDIAGKEAMVEEMMGLALASATAKVENPLGRFALGALAFGHVAVSWRRSQIVNRHYAKQAEKMIYRVEAGEITGQDGFTFTPMPVTPIFRHQRPTTQIPDSLSA
jgi:phosphatidylglycerophosphate synthase